MLQIETRIFEFLLNIWPTKQYWAKLNKNYIMIGGDSSVAHKIFWFQKKHHNRTRIPSGPTITVCFRRSVVAHLVLGLFGSSFQHRLSGNKRLHFKSSIHSIHSFIRFNQFLIKFVNQSPMLIRKAFHREWSLV